MINLLKLNPLFKVFNSTLVELPAPKNISLLWNIGSLLSMCLIIQILTGVLLASTYRPSIASRFILTNQIIETIDRTWLIRYIHANGASLFFICLYTHIGRGIYYNSYTLTHTWNIGVTIFILTIATAFIGYILPVNQISFWGASVITNLFSEVPYIGPDLVKTIWGGPSVDTPTVIRFFAFHFLLPFIILALVGVHITLLHGTGSSNPLGLTRPHTKIKFNPNYSLKDLIGVFLIFLLFLLLCLYNPLALGDDENFINANPAVTPQHIQPEWYFLFAYAILRSIPNKLGGVIALLLSVVILYTLPYNIKIKTKSSPFNPPIKILFWLFVVNLILLTWIGIRPVEDPYIFTGQILTTTYFLYFFIQPILNIFWEKTLNF